MPKVASEREVEGAADVLARAFAADPVLIRLLGHRRRRDAALRRFFEIEVGLAVGGRGEVWLDDDLLGAAVWRPPGAWPEAAKTPVGATLAYARVFSRRFVLAGEVATALARAHPAEPHWYLPFVGVAPEAAGSGRGTALLAPVLSRCDQERTGAYLEATSEASARLFARLGFEERAALTLPGGTVIRPMWREPQLT